MLKLKVTVRCIITTGFFAGMLSFLTVPVFAAPKGLIIGPSVKEVTISPKANLTTFPIYITNNTLAEVTLAISMVDFGALDETGGVLFFGKADSLKKKYGLAGWSSLDKESISLQPGKSGEVTVTISNRSSLALGGHYGAVLFELAAPPSNDSQKVKLNQVFSTLVLAKKTGGEVYKQSLSSIEHLNNYFALPENIKLRFYNEGNVHLTPGGLIRLIDPLGREVARGIINPEAGRVLPEKHRLFLTKLTYHQSAWVPGRYQVVVKHNFDERNHFITDKSSFLFINGLGIVLGVGVLLTFIYITWLWRRKKYRYAKKQPSRLQK